MNWRVADVTDSGLPLHTYDLWHDRAVFHFLTEAEDRRQYVQTVIDSVRPGGHVIVAAFAEDGPQKCSGLPVVRYRAEQLQAEFGGQFVLIEQEKEYHRTPSGAVQPFVYCRFRKRPMS